VSDNPTLTSELRELLQDLADLKKIEHSHRHGFFGERAQHREEERLKARLANDVRSIIAGAAEMFRSTKKRSHALPLTGIAGGVVALIVLRRLFAHR
jgi:hypothetical protein